MATSSELPATSELQRHPENKPPDEGKSGGEPEQPNGEITKVVKNAEKIESTNKKIGDDRVVPEREENPPKSGLQPQVQPLLYSPFENSVGYQLKEGTTRGLTQTVIRESKELTFQGKRPLQSQKQTSAKMKPSKIQKVQPQSSIQKSTIHTISSKPQVQVPVQSVSSTSHVKIPSQSMVHQSSVMQRTSLIQQPSFLRQTQIYPNPQVFSQSQFQQFQQFQSKQPSVKLLQGSQISTPKSSKQQSMINPRVQYSSANAQQPISQPQQQTALQSQQVLAQHSRPLLQTNAIVNQQKIVPDSPKANFENTKDASRNPLSAQKQFKQLQQPKLKPQMQKQQQPQQLLQLQMHHYQQQVKPPLQQQQQQQQKQQQQQFQQKQHQQQQQESQRKANTNLPPISSKKNTGKSVPIQTIQLPVQKGLYTYSSPNTVFLQSLNGMPQVSAQSNYLQPHILLPQAQQTKGQIQNHLMSLNTHKPSSTEVIPVKSDAFTYLPNYSVMGNKVLNELQTTANESTQRGNESESNNPKQEEIEITINGRSVYVNSETDDTSLYSLCRRWLKGENKKMGSEYSDIPKESFMKKYENVYQSQPLTLVQSSHLSQPFLPKPSVAKDAESDDSDNSKESFNTDNKNSSPNALNSSDLLKSHLNHFKFVKRKYKEEKCRNLNRFRRRLSMLLPSKVPT